MVKNDRTRVNEGEGIGFALRGPTLYVALFTGEEGMRIPSPPIIDFQLAVAGNGSHSSRNSSHS